MFSKRSRTEQRVPYQYNHKEKLWKTINFQVDTEQSIDSNINNNNPIIEIEEEDQKAIQQQTTSNANSATITEKDMKINPELIVLSFNVWFADQDWKQRQSELIRILEEQKPHVFCLQEVVHHFLHRLTEFEFIRDNYTLSDIANNHSSIGAYGVIIGVQNSYCKVLDLQLSQLKTHMDRKLLSMHISLQTPTIGNRKQNESTSIWINTAHLESKEWSEPTRIMQLDEIFLKHMPNMKQSESMFMGDFNFRDNVSNKLKVDLSFAENEHIPNSFVDCWKEYCKEVNVKMKVSDGWTRRIGYRYDRILMCSSKWKVIDFQILGDTETQMPSDHKGVVTRLQYCKN